VFSGTASVGRFFKSTYKVISNDILYFSYVLQRGLITLNSVPSFTGLRLNSVSNENRVKEVLEYLNSLKGIEGFVCKHYTPNSKHADGIERMYFSVENGMKIDAVRLQIEEWLQLGKINEEEYFYLLTTLILAVQRISNISGNYYSFNKFWDPRSHKPLTLRYIDVIPSEFQHVAYNRNVFDILDEMTCDIAYIDPPYNSRQYITNYHLLETIARYDNPAVKGKTGVREYTDEEKSVFCSKKKAFNAFLKLLSGLRSKYFVISYNNEGILSKDQIFNIMEMAGIKNIKVYEIPYRKFKSNSAVVKSEVIEYLFVGYR
ncbi:MAG TPA: hypothetical protein ENO30_01570, partial [Thermodesulfobium narugense]|nr:hypothetical protein [Thermodesulfobium narugense]